MSKPLAILLTITVPIWIFPGLICFLIYMIAMFPFVLYKELRQDLS